jgi:hypothetical protein
LLSLKLRCWAAFCEYRYLLLVFLGGFSRQIEAEGCASACKRHARSVSESLEISSSKAKLKASSVIYAPDASRGVSNSDTFSRTPSGIAEIASSWSLSLREIDVCRPLDVVLEGIFHY